MAVKKTEPVPPVAESKREPLRVTAPLVVVKNAKGSIVNLSQGDVVPDGTQQESIDHLLSLGYVE